MLVPHRREDAELGDGRLAADQLENALVFVGLETMLGDQLGSDLRLVRNHGAWLSLGNHAACAKCATSPANSPRPSVQPTAFSTWFSGCGIRPSTLSFSLSTPAIELRAPFTFQFASRFPSASV